MPTYAVQRLIAAEPQTIWNLLTDAPEVVPDMNESFGQLADGLRQAAEGG